MIRTFPPALVMTPPSGLVSNYTLQDNLTSVEGRIFITGTQAIARLLVMQRRIDADAGLSTAGFVSGYRGSPLAGLDVELWRAREILEAHDVRFVPGVNEDLAATAMMGTQQAGHDPERTVDGVFGLWYGKGPGVDRAGDALRHGNAAGASRLGGVLLVVGDDHAATSSSIPNASDLSFAGWGTPVLHPASVEEFVDAGLWGWAASRYSGLWVAMKTISETVESGRSIRVGPVQPFVKPPHPDVDTGALEFRTTDFLTPAIEVRLAQRLEAFAEFARANPGIDRLVVPAPAARLGLVTVGKAHHDAMAALEALGLPAERLAAVGIRVYRPGLVFPLESTRIAEFARGLEHVLVIEEKAGLVEQQVKDLLYNRPASARPTVAGKRDVEGRPFVPWVGQLRPALLRPLLHRWLSATLPEKLRPPELRERLPEPATTAAGTAGPRRLPYFCSGCPHSTSTRVPEGSKALAGVGCHYMASWMDRSTSGLTQMGGEGADRVGLAPFTRTPHVFQNMGEGTYFHSGFLAIRQAIAARVNVTYKILFNDAVAMTGGQPVDGTITVPQICAQLVSEGARRVVVATDEPQRYASIALPAGVEVHHRRELDRLQRELREVPGVTALVYDQTCAAEKRRRRKKGEYPDPPKRLFINEAVCEACGDCGIQSNCVSIVPQPTALGTKRRIDQSSCNKDYSCAEGFCPSFVAVMDAPPRGGRATPEIDLGALVEQASSLPPPQSATPSGKPVSLLIAGVGGTGVITLGAVCAMAAHLEGRGASVLDFTALAQKGGSVLSHLRIAASPEDLGPVRIEPGEADALIACDAVVATLPEPIAAIDPACTRVLVNRDVASLAEFTRDGNAIPDAQSLLDRLSAASPGRTESLHATRLAVRLFGDSIAANMLMLGFAWQRGWVPVSLQAFDRALELNGVAVESNRRAFAIGRLAAARPEVLEEIPARVDTVTLHRPERTRSIVETRRGLLAGYQDEAYARRFETRLHAFGEAVVRRVGEASARPLVEAAARNLFRVMAYKDEYEVARLYTTPEFRKALEREFGPVRDVRVQLAPPLFARRHPSSGRPLKREYGAWMFVAMRVLAPLRVLRGTPLDPFGRTAERRAERALIRRYEALMDEIASSVADATLDTALELLRAPDSVRGFGHVKQAALERFERKLDALLQAYRGAVETPAGARVLERVLHRA